MKIKIKRSLKEMDDTQPPMGDLPDPEKFKKDQEPSRGDKLISRMADERAERARKYYDHVKTLEPAPLEPEVPIQKDFGFDEKYGYNTEFDKQFRPPDIPPSPEYDPDKDPYGPLQEVAKRHFPKR
jgi:hypothetical protein